MTDLARMDVDGAARTITVRGAPPGRYYVRLRGVNYTGTSEPSDQIIVDVP